MIKVSHGADEQSGPQPAVFKSADLIDFTQGLTTLVKARIPIDKALTLLSSLTDKDSTRQLVESLRRDVKEGKTLAQAMEKQPGVFSKMYISMINAGEQGGILDQLLPSMLDFLTTAEETRKQIISALIYPAILFVVGVLSVILMLAFVVPQFATLFEDAGPAIPASASFLLFFSDMVRQFGWLLAVLPFAGYYAWKHWGSTEEGKNSRDQFLLKLPLMGNLLLEKEAMIFCQTLGALLKSGIPLFKSLRITRGVVNNSIISQQLLKVEEEVTGGMTLGGAITRHTAFPVILPRLVSVGEETGRTAEMLIQLADNFDKSVKNTLAKLVALAEPVLILALGLLVGGIVITMLSAVFSLNDMGV